MDVQLLLCLVLFPSFVQNSAHHSYIVSIELILLGFRKSSCGATIPHYLGVRHVIDIVKGNGHSDRSSNLRRSSFHFP